MRAKWLNETNVFYAALILAFVILSIPLATRIIRFEGLMMGSEPYYHARIASGIASQGIPKNDNLSFDQRAYRPNPYHLLLAFASGFMSIELVSMVIPIIFGLASLVFFYLLLKRLGFDLRVRFFSLLILIASPAFISTFTSSSPACFAIFISLLAIYLFLDKKDVFKFMAAALFIVTAFFSFFSALIVSLFLFFYGAYQRKQLNICLFLCLLVLITGFVYNYPNFIVQSVSSKNMLTDFLADMGANIGFGLFNIILAGIGFVIKWREKKRLFIFYALISFFLLSMLLFTFQGAAYLNFALALLAGFGFVWLLDVKWELSMIKSLTMTIIVCGLIFSSLSYLNRASLSMPDEQFAQSLKWLASYASPEDVVLSHYSYGFWIEYFTGNKVMMDDLRTPNYESIQVDYNKILFSRSLEDTKELLSEYKIKQIIITDEMRSGLVWSREEEELLFLFRNNETFKNVYNKDYVEIWEYIG